MFTKTAKYYDALYRFKDYSQACRELDELIQVHTPGASTLLDVGCGTGKHLEHLSLRYKTEGLDLNPELLEVARERCPNANFHEGDMTNFDLGKTFDVVVCLFSSIAYVRTVENLKRSVARMAAHLKPGGFLLLEPWITPENYWVDRLTANFVDELDLKIAWMYVSELVEGNSVFDIHYMVATQGGITEFRENHVMGLWTHEEYRSAFIEAGVTPEYDANGLFGRGIYYGTAR